MGMFVTDLSKDPFGGKINFCIYSAEKIGKTTMVFKMLKEHPEARVYLISADNGDTAARLDPAPYQGRLAIARPKTLKEWRDTLKELKVKVQSSIAKGTIAGNVWAVVDHVTSMQGELLSESRKLAVSVGKSGKGNIAEAGDEYSRDMLTQVDYNVNLGHMTEITNELLSLPCNVLMLGLEKKGFDGGPYSINLSGQGKAKVLGDADVIARLVVGDKDSRVLICHPTDDTQAGDRTGKLAKFEPPDLWALRQKIFNK